VKYMGKKAQIAAMRIAATLPAPNQYTNRGRRARSGKLPQSITVGVRVRSTRFFSPVQIASGAAMKSAMKIPVVRFMKLCSILDKNVKSLTQ